MVEAKHEQLSIRRQVELLSLSRSGYYYEPKTESADNLELMKVIDKLYTAQPFLGRRTMHERLVANGYPINHKRVDRLMRLMGLAATVPGPHTSKRRKEHKKYPYLLRNLSITRPNQVWAADITYLPLAMGFLYLVAIMDWFARYILSWELSNSLESDFCVSALKKALKKAKPEIFNTDQGSQFTAEAFVDLLKDMEIKVSMDGKGRFRDNIMVERFWRTLKYEEVYLNEYETGWAAKSNIERYMLFYNNDRRHTSLGKMTPSSIYYPC